MSSSPAHVQPCPADRQLSSPVQGVYDPGRLDIGQDPDRPSDPEKPAAVALLHEVEELLRCALIAKLAVDLDDRSLARRATRDAQTASARLLALPWPNLAADDQPSDDQPLSLERILRRITPLPLGTRAIEDQAVRLRIAEPEQDWPLDDEDAEPPATWTEA